MFKLPDIDKEGEIERNIALILKNKIYPEEKLRECLEFVFRKKIPTKEVIKSFKKDFHSNQYGFDTVYKFKMLMTSLLINSHEYDDGLVISLLDIEEIFFNWIDSPKLSFPISIIKQKSSRFSFVKAGKKKNSYNKSDIEKVKKIIDEKRNTLKIRGNELLKKIRPQIKARLALLECFTIISLDDFIPDILKVCPKYISCPFVAQRINQWAYGAKIGDEKMMKSFKKVFSALKDKRTSANKTIYRNWYIVHRHHLLEKCFATLFRIDESESYKSYKSFIEWAFSLNKKCVSLINNNFKPKDIALYIILQEKLVKDECAFKKIHNKVKTLLNKHHKNDISVLFGKHIDQVIIQQPFLIDDPVLWSLFD